MSSEHTRPTFGYEPSTEPTPAIPAPHEASPRVELSNGQRVALERQLTDDAKSGKTLTQLTQFLVAEGFAPDEAKAMAAKARAKGRAVANTRRQAVEAQRSQARGFAWFEIIGGIAVLLGGLAAGWFLVFAFVPIIDGIRRLGS